MDHNTCYLISLRTYNWQIQSTNLAASFISTIHAVVVTVAYIRQVIGAETIIAQLVLFDCFQFLLVIELFKHGQRYKDDQHYESDTYLVLVEC